MGSVKKEGDSVKKGKCDNKTPYMQFLCTAHLYSTKHTVVLIRTCSLHRTQPHQPSIPPFQHLSLISTCQILLIKERMWSKAGCNETGGGEMRMEKVTEKGEQKPHIQFLCTAPLYSIKHTAVLIRSCSLHSTQPHQASPNTSHPSVRKPSIQLLCTAHLYSAKHIVVVIRIYIILIKFTDLISFLLSKTSDQLFPYLNLLKKSGKRGDLFVPFLNFINKITTTVCSSLYT